MTANVAINILLFLSFAFDIFLAYFLIFRAPKKDSTAIFGFSTLFVGLWTLGILMFRLSTSYAFYLFWNREFIFMSGFIASTFLHFSLALTGYKLSNFKKNVLYLPNLFIFIFLFVPNALIRDIVVQDWGKESLLGSLYPLFGLYFSVYVLISLYRILKSVRESKGLLKTQLFYILLATLLTSIVGIYFNLYLILLGNYRYIWIGPYNSLVLVTVSAYAITKHELMDIKVAITRTAAYGSVIVMLVASFLALNLIKMPILIIFVSNATLCLFWVYFADRLRALIQTPIEEKWITG